MSQSISLTPIGYIRSQFQENTPSESMREELSQVVVEPEFVSGLMGLEPEQDVLILFYFHKIQPEEIHLQLHPRHNPENPRQGVFATRSQFRPNRIGASVACIQQIDGNVITVKGLDAQDGTPVLDLKPHALYFDASTREQQLEVKPVASLKEARDKIDLIDAEIIRLLGHRAEYVQQVTRFKKRPEDVPAPARYAEVIRTRRKMAEAVGFNPDVIERMYRLLVDNFIEEEIEIIRQRAVQQS